MTRDEWLCPARTPGPLNLSAAIVSPRPSPLVPHLMFLASCDSSRLRDQTGVETQLWRPFSCIPLPLAPWARLMHNVQEFIHSPTTQTLKPLPLAPRVRLMHNVQEFIDSPGERDIEVQEIFTNDMWIEVAHPPPPLCLAMPWPWPA